MNGDKRIILATTFSREEVKALIRLMSLIDRRGDVYEIMKSDEINSLRRKFLKMRAKGER